MDSIGCLVLDGIEYKVDSWVLKLWEVYYNNNHQKNQREGSYLLQFKDFCRGILHHFKDSK